MGTERNADTFLMCNLPGRLRSRREDNITETGCEEGRWPELVQDSVQWLAFVRAVLKPSASAAMLLECGMDWIELA